MVDNGGQLLFGHLRNRVASETNMTFADMYRLLNYGTAVFAQRTVCKNICRIAQPIYRAQPFAINNGLPKQPPTPFCRFMLENQSKVLEKYTDIDRKELLRRLSVMWYELSDEQRVKYSIEYRNARREFMEKLGPDERRELLAKRRERGRKKERNKLALTISEQKSPGAAVNDKPRKSPSAFLLFVQSKLKERYSRMRQPGNKMPQTRDLIKSLAEEWKRLDIDEKVKLKERAAQMNREYELKLKTWEDEMVRTGRWYLLSPSKQLDVSTSDEYLRGRSAAVKNISPKTD